MRALRRHSRELRMHSAATLGRGRAAMDQLELRREMLRAQFEALRARRSRAREPLAGDDAEMRAWMVGEVLGMITAGWTRRELAEVGIGPDLLRELGLDDHPALGPDGD
ncbi:hypothetical protein [Longimicrobium sp.]|uniref:hypothetical protein n=1 Tax=Longimicrobium sp. TaxID=2029185 RepID=UPI002E325986|nr:hypothetical protein [Longimicrobium sp.]HEX6037967.1 hypothetical protein [Longimicrobium sp.]